MRNSSRATWITQQFPDLSQNVAGGGARRIVVEVIAKLNAELVRGQPCAFDAGGDLLHRNVAREVR